MTPFGFAGWIELIAIAAIVAIFLAVRRKGFRAFIATVAGMLVVMAGLFLARMHFAWQRTTVVAPSVVSATSAAPLAEALDTPDTGPDLDTEADVYPSIRTAAIVTSKALLKSLDSLVPAGTRLSTAHVLGKVDKDLLASVANAIRPSLGQVQVVVGDSPPTSRPAEADPHTITLRIDEMGRSGPGSLEVALYGPSGSKRQFVRVADKRWLEDLQRFRQEHGSGELIVAMTGFEKNLPDAQNRAIRRAAQSLLPYVSAEIERTRTNVSVRSQQQQEWLLRRLEEDLSRGMFIRDRFAQRFDRPYGQVYRTAMLLDVSAHALNGSATEYFRTLENLRTGSQTSFRRTVLSGLGLVLLICLMYLFLNAATKGYYVWPLRVVGILAVTAGILIVLRIA